MEDDDMPATTAKHQDRGGARPWTDSGHARMSNVFPGHAARMAAHANRIRRHLRDMSKGQYGRPCPDCGRAKAKNKSRCYECAEKQARKKAMERQRRCRRHLQKTEKGNT